MNQEPQIILDEYFGKIKLAMQFFVYKYIFFYKYLEVIQGIENVNAHQVGQYQPIGLDAGIEILTAFFHEFGYALLRRICQI
jgi:hypothetical protein